MTKPFGQPFARATAMMGMIAAAMSLGNTAMQQQAMAKIGPYESRGKGQGKSNQRPAGAGMAFKRAAMKKRRVKAHRARARG